MTGSPIDHEKIVTQVLTELAKAAFKGAGATIKNQIDKLISAYNKDFSAYLRSTLLRCSRVKTILNRDHPVSLLDIYVTTRLRCKDKEIDDTTMLEAIPAIKNIVVVGTAGSGKSMLMRYLYICLSEKSHGRIPLFIELRHMNALQLKDLVAFMYYSIATPGATLTQEQLDSGLKAGLFSIIFDGFDEIDFDLRSDIERQLLTLQVKYPENIYIVSSRPDDRFESWESFYIYRMNPMKQKEIVSLIKKLDYDKDTKNKFIKTLQDGLYNRHESFLSNPLLAIMMLITFEQFAHIPDKIHIFYEQAFDALFFKHDASKQGGYRRKSYSSLPIDDFKKCFSCFCILTYAKEKFLFTDSEAREYILKAFEYEKRTAPVESFVKDLLESVCMLQRDGLFLTFSHRSFQEYFSAHFITKASGPAVHSLLNQIAKRRTDSVIQMSFDINRMLIQREWILPKIKEIAEAVTRTDIDKDILDYLSIFFKTVRFSWGGDMIRFSVDEATDLGAARSCILQLYGDHFKGNTRPKPSKKAEQEIFRSIYLNLEESKDERLSSPRQRSSKISKARTPSRLSLVLKKEDHDLIKRTWILNYTKQEKQLFIELKSIIEEAVGQQEAIVDSLFE